MYFTKEGMQFLENQHGKYGFPYIIEKIYNGISYFMEVDDDDMDGLLFQAMLYENAGNHDYAIDCYRKVQKLDPKHYEAQHQIGWCFLKKDDYANALQEFNKAIEICPTNAKAYTGRAYLKYFFHHDLKGAMNDSYLAIEMDSLNFEGYSSCAMYLKLTKDFKGADEMHTKIINIAPQEGWRYEMRGKERLEWKDYIGAIEDFNMGVQLDPSLRYCYTYSARAKYYLGDRDGAYSDLVKAALVGNTYAYVLLEEFKLL